MVWMRLKEMSSGKKRAFLFLAAGALSFGSASILVKLCAYPAAAIACLRILLAGLLLTPLCLPSLRELLRERGPRGYLSLLVPGLLLGAHFQLWTLGIKQTTVAGGTLIFSLNPVFFALFAALAEGKRISLHTALSLALIFLGGVWLIAVSQARLGRLGDLLCFASMLLFVAYLLVSRRASRGLPHLTYIHVLYLWGGLLTLPVLAVRGDFGRLPLGDTGSLLALLGLVLFPTLIGHTSENYGVRYFSPLTVSFFTLAEPVLSSLLAAALLREVPDPRVLPAYLLFFSATVLYLATAVSARD